jgi:hypothetical protein
MRQLIRDTSRNKQVSQTFRDELELRLEQIVTRLEVTFDFDAVQIELSQLRLDFERQKRGTLKIEKRVDTSNGVTRSTLIRYQPVPPRTEVEPAVDAWAQNIFSDN